MATTKSSSVVTSKKSRWKPWVGKGILIILGLVASVLIFTTLIPQFASFSAGWEAAKAMPWYWFLGVILASAFVIWVYPFTAIGAIPKLGYKAAFVDRQAGFVISTGIPWAGGGIAVATQYQVLAKYGVTQRLAAAAVAADAVWTYLITFGTPGVSLLLLFVVERRTVASQYEFVALIGGLVFLVSAAVIVLILRSVAGARAVGNFANSLLTLKPMRWVFRTIKRTPPDVASTVVGFNETASEMVASRWKQLTITNLLAQLSPLFVVIVTLYGLGASPGQVTWLEALVTYSVVLLVMSFPIAPGGFGTVDAAFIGLLIYFGADQGQATAVDIIWRGFTYLPQMLVGLIAFLVFWVDRRRGHTVKLEQA